jgi:hypothetical protein
LSYVKAYKGADPPVKVRQIGATEAPAAAQTAATAQEVAQEAAAKEAATQDNDDEKCPCCEGHMEAWRTLCLHCEAYFDAEAHFEADNDIMGSEGGGAAAEDGLETDGDATSKAAKSAGEKLSLETITDKGKIGACFANWGPQVFFVLIVLFGRWPSALLCQVERLHGSDLGGSQGSASRWLQRSNS